jgi:hypothetical protein
MMHSHIPPLICGTLELYPCGVKWSQCRRLEAWFSTCCSHRRYSPVPHVTGRCPSYGTGKSERPATQMLLSTGFPSTNRGAVTVDQGCMRPTLLCPTRGVWAAAEPLVADQRKCLFISLPRPVGRRNCIAQPSTPFGPNLPVVPGALQSERRCVNGSEEMKRQEESIG